MKCLALDDESPALKIIETFANQVDLISELKSFLRTKEALFYLKNNQVDVLFIDIQMPGISGLDFVKSLDYKPLVIFTTSHFQYAIESYELNAVDYLLKPFSQKRFHEAVKKAHDLLKMKKDVSLDFFEQYFIVKLDYGIKRIPLKTILFIKSWDNYIKIYTDDSQEYLVRKTLKEALVDLPEDSFIQVHRSYIINSSKVKYYRSKIIRIEDIDIPISKSYSSKVLKFFNLED